MTPSHDTTADVPSLLEAMVGWLDPADDPAEPIVLRRRHAPTPVGDRPGPTAAPVRGSGSGRRCGRASILAAPSG